jgi:hypothetical protein
MEVIEMFVRKSRVKEEIETMLGIAQKKESEEQKIIGATCFMIASKLNIRVDVPITPTKGD